MLALTKFYKTIIVEINKLLNKNSNVVASRQKPPKLDAPPIDALDNRYILQSDINWENYCLKNGKISYSLSDEYSINEDGKLEK